jgi:5-formyltetrahydrofolate cyclo-ligase
VRSLGAVTGFPIAAWWRGGRPGRRIPTPWIQPGDPAIDLFSPSQPGRLAGEGAGYSDIEVALLQEAGLIGPRTVIVTTVHHLQVVDEALPETGHDPGTTSAST